MEEALRRTRVCESPRDVAEAVAELFVERAAAAIAARGIFTVALAGGTTPLLAYGLLAEAPHRDRVPWGAVEVFFGDERCVAEGHPDRNDRAAREVLLSRVPVAEERVHPVPATAPDGAARYEELIRARLGANPPSLPRLDLVLLGLGPDGHTASLFPGSPALTERAALVVKVSGAPKPPPERVTFTLPLLNAAAAVVFVVTGAEKREAVAGVLSGDMSLPASRVEPAGGETLFLLDRDASGEA